MNDSPLIHILISIVLFFQCFIFTVAIFAVNPLFVIAAVVDFYCFAFHIDYAKKIKKEKSMKVEKQESQRSTVSGEKGAETGAYHHSFKEDTKTGPKTKLEVYDQLSGNDKESSRAVNNETLNKRNDQTSNIETNSGVFMGTDGKPYFTRANKDEDVLKQESSSKKPPETNTDYSKEFDGFSMPDSSSINIFFGKTGVDRKKDNSTFPKKQETKPKDTRSFGGTQTSPAYKTNVIKGKIEIQTKGRIDYYFGLVETYRSAYDWGLLDGAEDGEEYPLYEYKKLPCQLSQDEEKYTVYVDPGNGMKYLGIIPRTTESETAIESGRKWHVEVDGGSTYIGKGKSYEKVWLPLHFYLMIDG